MRQAVLADCNLASACGVYVLASANLIQHSIPPHAATKPVDMPCCQARERDWCNVVTAHEGDSAAYTWRLQHYALGNHVLRPPKESAAGPLGPVSAVAMSRCGNFAVVGSKAGRSDRYNMQSGLHRGTFCRQVRLAGPRHPCPCLCQKQLSGLLQPCSSNAWGSHAGYSRLEGGIWTKLKQRSQTDRMSVLCMQTPI